METTFVPNGNDDDVIINYITDMDLSEDSDSHFFTLWLLVRFRTALLKR